ncbi:hypothetical protein AO391_24940 [Pseudomonas marginalis ICMP 9505]|nr:hypothetical protein AO391_24940 [Pseudomonas marginalis ICMP 9505]
MEIKYCIFLLASAISLFSVSVQAVGHNTALCPSKDFSEFLSAFSDSSVVQEEFTQFPLRKLITVDAEPEPRQEVTYLKRADAKFPLLPVKQDRATNGLEMLVVNKTAVGATVKLEKPDTDYQVLYVFKFASCWFLEEVKDYSL